MAHDVEDHDVEDHGVVDHGVVDRDVEDHGGVVRGDREASCVVVHDEEDSAGNGDPYYFKLQKIIFCVRTI